MDRYTGPALAKSPERPIGADSGITRYRTARFTTISGTPVDRLYISADSTRLERPSENPECPVSPRTRATFTPPAIAASCSPCANFPVSPHRKKPTNATNICCNRAAAAFPVAFDSLTLNGYYSFTAER